MNSITRAFALLLFLLVANFAPAADYPVPTEGDYTIYDFKFASGESLRSCGFIIAHSEDRKKMLKAKQ